MTKYDEPKCPADGGVGARLKKYFGNLNVACPYGLPQRAVYHQAQFGSISEETMGYFFDNGYRRNGNYIYSMHCPTCRGCVPIRLRPSEFQPNRSQRRVLKKNKDVSIGVAPLTMSKENLNLLDRFLAIRFPKGGSSAISYYSGFFLGNLTRSFEIRYRIGEKLLGVSIVDYSPDWLNAVYFYFDPEENYRSPGTLNILTLINFCSRHDIESLYLGYWIQNVSAMSYKTKFKPYELLIDGQWRKDG